MRKWWLAIVFLVITAGILIVIGFRQDQRSEEPAEKAETDVSGLVSKNGKPAANIKVTAMCRGSTKADTTDSEGSYLIVFSSSECPADSQVISEAGSGHEFGRSESYARKITPKLNMAKLNIDLSEAR